MHADLATFEDVVAERVLVGIIDEHALFGCKARTVRSWRRLRCLRRRHPMLSRLAAAHAGAGPTFRRLHPPAHGVANDLGAVGKVEQQAPVAVPVRDVAPHRQPVRVHDREAGDIAGRDVFADLAVVGVHVVDREAQVAEQVVAEAVLPRRVREDAVAPIADVVVLDHRARRVPDIDAVAAFVHAVDPEADNGVAAHHRILAAMHVDPVHVVPERGALDQRPVGALDDLDPGIEIRVPSARPGDGDAADHHVIAGDGDDRPVALAINHGVRGPGQCKRPVDGDGAGIGPAREHEHIAGRRAGDGFGQRARTRHDLHLRSPKGRGEQHQYREQAFEHDQAAFGSTNIRPRISMWSAWQNHWQ